MQGSQCIGLSGRPLGQRTAQHPFVCWFDDRGRTNGWMPAKSSQHSCVPGLKTSEPQQNSASLFVSSAVQVSLLSVSYQYDTNDVWRMKLTLTLSSTGPCKPTSNLAQLVTTAFESCLDEIQDNVMLRRTKLSCWDMWSLSNFVDHYDAKKWLDLGLSVQQHHFAHRLSVHLWQTDRQTAGAIVLLQWYMTAQLTDLEAIFINVQTY